MIVFFLGFGLGLVAATAATPKNRAAVLSALQTAPGKMTAWIRNRRD